MNAKIAKILDECLARISNGESAESCLAQYDSVRQQLEPLLCTALSISSVPRALPSEEFRREAKGRLMARLHQEVNHTKVVELEERASLLDELAMAGQRLWQAFAGAKRVVAPVMLGLMLIIAVSFGASNFISPSSTLASGCTLSILSGEVEIQVPGANNGQQGIDGMTLDVGTRIATSSNSHALLTFFDGSALKIEPNSDIEIKQLAGNEQRDITIVLKQWTGKTWSRVIKMADPGSHYEIQTPSAVALVRGTQFLTEVDEKGATRVHTTEGLVSVSAKSEEVYVPAGQQTTVEIGESPSVPMTVTTSEDVEPQWTVQEEQPENSSSEEKPVVQVQSQNGNMIPGYYGSAQSISNENQVNDNNDQVKDKDQIDEEQGIDKNKPVKARDLVEAKDLVKIKGMVKADDPGNNGQGHDKSDSVKANDPGNNGQGNDKSDSVKAEDPGNNGQGNDKSDQVSGNDKSDSMKTEDPGNNGQGKGNKDKVNGNDPDNKIKVNGNNQQLNGIYPVTEVEVQVNDNSDQLIISNPDNQAQDIITVIKEINSP